MDYMGILKEAWDVTRRNKRLWILGLFASGSASLSSNWNSNSSNSSKPDGPPPGWENVHSPNEALQRGLDLAGKELGTSLGTAEQWWVILAGMALLLLVLCLVFWVIGIAARGGLIDQTREALSGRPTSAGAGWRRGFSLWGRVFSVGFVFALPFMGLGLLALLALAAFGLPALIASGGNPALIASGAVPGAMAGIVSMGFALAFLGFVAFVLGLVVSVLIEVALRYAVLEDMGAIDSIKASWADLKAKRGMASMWLVMILVNIAVGIAAAIVFIPVVIVVGFVVAASVAAGGLGMLWLIAPGLLVLLAMGMLLKAVYSTFRNTVWTSFFGRMRYPAEPGASQPQPDAPGPGPDAPQSELVEPVAV
jgi:uncharacterized membrane protein